jgi:hypothetical protein
LCPWTSGSSWCVVPAVLKQSVYPATRGAP